MQCLPSNPLYKGFRPLFWKRKNNNNKKQENVYEKKSNILCSLDLLSNAAI